MSSRKESRKPAIRAAPAAVRPAPSPSAAVPSPGVPAAGVPPGAVPPVAVAAGEATARLNPWLIAAVLFALTILIYLPSINGDVLWDDTGHVTKPELRSFEGLR